LSELTKTTRQSVRESSTRLQHFARQRADEQARRVPWQRLQEARNHYIDWQEFCFWVRSIVETEGDVPGWLSEILRERCPGFLDAPQSLSEKRSRVRPLSLQLEDWIDDHFFSYATKDGWFNAITYYAVRDPRYRRAEACWTECVEKWQEAKPAQYPTFDQWKAMAAQCDDAAHLSDEEHKIYASVRQVDPDRLAAAVAQYLDCEALAYWARHALESGSTVPSEIERELELRCPGFLESELKTRQRSGSNGQEWRRLMTWFGDHEFKDAKTQGWFNAVLAQVCNHPRAIRTMEYADYCDELWTSQMPSPYPSFQEWRNQADSYIATPSD
jgi:hypothetical protein